MRRSQRVLSVMLAVFLLPALALLGSYPAEAKKKPKPPPEPELVWEVEIPECSDTPCLGYECNLCGDSETTYRDLELKDGVHASVTKKRDKGDWLSQFAFAVFKCEEGECLEFGPPPPVQLQKIIFMEAYESDNSKGPCGFPPDVGTGNRPGCMSDFLNDFPHPYWSNVDPDDADYRYFSIVITVGLDFEALPNGPYPTVAGLVDIELFNTDDRLATPYEDAHNVDGRLKSLETAQVDITRDGDIWTVLATVPAGVFRFVEIYKGSTGKGNSWEYKLPLKTWNLDPLAFHGTWRRLPE